MDSATTTLIAQLLIVIWALELVLLNATEKAAGAVRGAALGACALALALAAISLVAPPGGALLLAGIVGLHGLTIGLLFVAGRKPLSAASHDRAPSRRARKAARLSLRRDGIMRSL
jgi:hypothetical protein